MDRGNFICLPGKANNGIAWSIKGKRLSLSPHITVHLWDWRFRVEGSCSYFFYRKPPSFEEVRGILRDDPTPQNGHSMAVPVGLHAEAMDTPCSTCGEDELTAGEVWTEEEQVEDATCPTCNGRKSVPDGEVLGAVYTKPCPTCEKGGGE
jgi:hypothetical protein